VDRDLNFLVDRGVRIRTPQIGAGRRAGGVILVTHNTRLPCRSSEPPHPILVEDSAKRTPYLLENSRNMPFSEAFDTRKFSERVCRQLES
jgi:hypothetical protein